MTAGCDRRRLPAVVTALLLAALLLVLAAIPASAAAHAPHPPAGAGSSPNTAPATAPAEAGDEGGLSVDLTAVTPSALQPGEPLELQGQVSNVDEHVWRRIFAYLVIAPSPLTSRAELAAAGDSSADAYFGDRIIELGLFERLGRLDPGEFRPFQLRVPWSKLGVSGAQGVYTVGVQVLATDLDGTRPTEGRVRTFIPLVDEPAADIRLALVWPLTGAVLRHPDGTYAHAGRLVRAMAPGGRLRRMVDLGRTSGSVPLTVVPDPAVLDAAADIGTGTYGPPGGTAGDTESASGTGGSAAVASWLDDTVDLLDESAPWATGYGQPAADTLAAADRRSIAVSLAAAGRAVSQQLLGGDERILTLPEGGTVDPDTLGWLRGLDGASAAALAPRMLPDWDPLEGAALTVPTDSGPLDTAVAEPALAAGGPAPGEPLTALQVRQRLLAETALLGIDAAAAGATSTSAVFVPPPEWDPGIAWPTTGYFTGLQVDWLQPVPLDDLLASPRPYQGATGLADEEQPAARLLPSSMVAAAGELDGRVRVLTNLLDDGRSTTSWYDAAVALGVSAAGLRDSTDRLRQTERVTASVRDQLREVTITGPDFVTLSSTRGRFPLTVTNRLDRSVTVSVRVLSEDAEPVPGARFTTGGPITIRPGRSDTVTVDTRVGRAGVTSARAYLVTESGRRLGTPLDFNLRTSVVGRVIWGILGLACAVLAFAIVRRLVRRARGLPTPGSTR